jgi:selenocysteine lyase/cysteine desulfurase
MIRDVSFSPQSQQCDIGWNDPPWKFEAGTPNVAGGVTLAEAAIPATPRHDRRIPTRTHTHRVRPQKTAGLLHKTGTLRTTTRQKMRHHPSASKAYHRMIGAFLDNYGVMIRSGFHCAQPSPNLQTAIQRTSLLLHLQHPRGMDPFVEILQEMEQL